MTDIEIALHRYTAALVELREAEEREDREEALIDFEWADYDTDFSTLNAFSNMRHRAAVDAANAFLNWHNLTVE